MADGQDEGQGGGAGRGQPGLADLQHWTGVIGQAQQMLMIHAAEAAQQIAGQAQDMQARATATIDPDRWFDQGRAFWEDNMALWQHFLGAEDAPPLPAAATARDRRFAAPQWEQHPLFALIRQSYLLMTDHLLRGVDTLEGLAPRQREQLRFAARTFADAMSPANFPVTNPVVMEKIFETRGDNLLRGLERMAHDMGRGQVTHTDAEAFEVGRNIAATPGKVVRETPLYQLIQYDPVGDKVERTPLVIFPPWINRFYILDLNAKNSFVRWAVEQGLTVFMVSWKSADATMADMTMDDYVLKGQADAIDAVRELLGVESVHTIGYCVAGTTLAMTLAWLAAEGQAAKVASATFFTAQVDFADAGELSLFVDDDQIGMIAALAGEEGYIDGRYLAATFNLLRGRDLIWNYVVNNYLLAEDYPVFDLLHWNGDVTNLPAAWHRRYLEDFYRDNRLVQPGALKVAGVPIDLGRIETPAYIQAGREDHIAPAGSVWKMTQHLSGPMRFVLAGSGHIAGVVNPPAACKYQYWTADGPGESLDDFIARAKETKGSWWPDWIAWVKQRGSGTVSVAGARHPGGGAFPVIEDAPGRYVRMR